MSGKESSVNEWGEKSFVKAGFLLLETDGNASVIDVKDGKIVRIRPLHFDWKYRPEDFRP